MGESLSDMRMAENEVVFRQANERVTKSVAETKAVAAEEGQQATVHNIDDEPLFFVCECSNDTCRKRISMSLNEYEQCHQYKSQFVVFPGHNVSEIERIMKQTKKYMVVQKYMTPPDKADTLHPVG